MNEIVKEVLNSMDNNELLELKKMIEDALTQERPKHKYAGGESLWHKEWKSVVRPTYDDEWKVETFWDIERREWAYFNKYGSYDGHDNIMYESDLTTELPKNKE
ncbi:MAG: hypothetical protein AABY32_04085 [Nanoarchaeota archaeon]